MPDWSIKIVPAENPTTDLPAAFVPDLSGAQPGTPLNAQVDDIVTWNNTTNEDHWPWPVDYNGNPLPDAQVSTQFGNFFSEKIAAGMSSRPSYNVPSVPFSGTTINYCCKLHPKVLGQICSTRRRRRYPDSACSTPMTRIPGGLASRIGSRIESGMTCSRSQAVSRSVGSAAT